MDQSHRRPPASARTFSVEDAGDEFRHDRGIGATSSSRHRPSSSRRRSHLNRHDRPPVSEVHFTDDPSVGATSTPITGNHIHVHHRHHQHQQQQQQQHGYANSEIDLHARDSLSPDDVSPPRESTGDDYGDDSGDTLIHTTDGDDEFDDTSDTASIESFTLRERQDAINETHPFGIRIWKPALYKKDRSVQRLAEGDIHAAPDKKVSWVVWVGNYIWAIFFGFPLWVIIQIPACFILAPFAWDASAREYGRAFFNLANYLIFPFGKFVQLDQDENYALEDEGEGRSLGEYEEWRTGSDRGRLFFGPSKRRNTIHRSIPTRQNGLEPITETEGLLNRNGRPNDGSGSTSSDTDEAGPSSTSIGSQEFDEVPYLVKRRLFGRGEWNLGRILFFTWFYLLVYPSLLIVSAISWFLVFSIPMARVAFHLCSHLRRHPLALSFHHDGPITRSAQESTRNSTILLCTYRAFGWNYYKYTVDGTNVFLMNLVFIVVFTIFDQYLISKILGPNTFITSPGVIFLLGLGSVIPLAYFIGQAVASISAQSSMGMGAAINALFSTVVEVFLYCVALTEGKGRLVEGSVVGSILAGVLLMPGLSMCSGAIKRKTQRYNPKSAGVSSTMLLFAIIAAFAPTLFYQIYGSYQLNCVPCSPDREEEFPGPSVCRRCQFFLDPLINDEFYRNSVKPFSYLCAVLLFISYIIGLWFTLRTHAAMIWQASDNAPKPETVPSTAAAPINVDGNTSSNSRTVIKFFFFLVGNERTSDSSISLLGSVNHDGHQELPLIDLPIDEATNDWVKTTGDDNNDNIAEAKFESKGKKVRPELTTTNSQASLNSISPNGTTRRGSVRNLFKSKSASVKSKTSQEPEQTNIAEVSNLVEEQHAASGGHDAPNWSRFKSTIILLGATILYAVIAEILVDTVDVVLDSVSIDEKFLGITLFALVPNTTEFLNAISFAMNGNIALSMEIGSAYVLQVCLLQIPALILFSVWSSGQSQNLRDYTFSLVFPRWDLVVVVLCVFLLSYIYAEGRSNYFKGSILILAYIVVMAGFWFSGLTGEAKLSSIIPGGPHPYPNFGTGPVMDIHLI
ncbi:Sodium/calcium exchanger protein-domain-containing protein [Lipomyces japonicus]|uniref:Sodium/calcium exchanger protein-domain-containing protein n=1 Tax=Lipomyces japonicus TaxID=56871 RepID=UPI0034D00A43